MGEILTYVSRLWLGDREEERGGGVAPEELWSTINPQRSERRLADTEVQMALPK